MPGIPRPRRTAARMFDDELDALVAWEAWQHFAAGYEAGRQPDGRDDARLAFGRRFPALAAHLDDDCAPATPL